MKLGTSRALHFVGSAACVVPAAACAGASCARAESPLLIKAFAFLCLKQIENKILFPHRRES